MNEPTFPQGAIYTAAWQALQDRTLEASVLIATHRQVPRVAAAQSLERLQLARREFNKLYVHVEAGLTPAQRSAVRDALEHARQALVSLELPLLQPGAASSWGFR